MVMSEDHRGEQTHGLPVPIRAIATVPFHPIGRVPAQPRLPEPRIMCWRRDHSLDHRDWRSTQLMTMSAPDHGATASGVLMDISAKRVSRGSRRVVDTPHNTKYATQHDIESGAVVSIRHSLLALLSEGPKYGLQLREEFEARTGEVWPLNVGQVYTTLQRLERDGLVESDDDADPGPQKGFRITADGTEELADWLRTPPDLASPPRDELVIKILIAVRLPGVDVHEVIQSHRRYLIELMQQWTRLKEEEGDLDLGLALVVDAELYRLDAVVQWLDSADGRLKRAALEPPAAAKAAAPQIRRRAGMRR
jgi:DNA-binding PadR family transcriptional regulator